MYTRDHFLALPEDVIAFAWSAPMRDLAAEIGISDVGLKKLLGKHGIATPPHGYWAKEKAGKKVPAPPKPDPRGPGENGRIRLDGRFRSYVPETSRKPVDGPFASQTVPEDLEELLVLELKAIGKLSVRRDLGRPHRGLQRLLKKDEKRHQKYAESGWDWERPQHDNPFALRQLKIANAILKALSARGHSGELSAAEDGYVLWAQIGDTGIELSIAREDKVRLTSKELRELPPGTSIALKLQTRKGEEPTVWADEKGNRIEKQIGQIVAEVIVAGEARFRQSLVEAARFEEQQKKWKEEARREKLEKAEQQRLSDLRQSGELLRQAKGIRELVEQLSAAVESGQVEVSVEELAEWKSWAIGYADRIDPVLSGQVLTHIRVREHD